MTIMYLLWTIHTQKDTQKKQRDRGNVFTLDYVHIHTHKDTKNRDRESHRNRANVANVLTSNYKKKKDIFMVIIIMMMMMGLLRRRRRMTSSW